MEKRVDQLKALKEMLRWLEHSRQIDLHNQPIDARVEEESRKTNEYAEYERCKRKIAKLESGKSILATIIGAILSIIVFLLPMVGYFTMEEGETIITNSYLFIIALSISLFLGQIGIIGEFVEGFTDDHPIIGIILWCIVGALYLIPAITMWTGDVNFFIGLFWPVLIILAPIYHIFSSLSGNVFIPCFVESLFYTILLAINLVAACMVFLATFSDKSLDFVVKMRVNRITELEKKEEVYYSEWSKVYWEIREKYKSLYKTEGMEYYRVMEKYKYLIPDSDKNVETVRNLIWCIENNYAYDIVTAKQYLAQQAHNKKVQDKLNRIEKDQKEMLDWAKAPSAPVEVDVNVTVDWK